MHFASTLQSALDTLLGRQGSKRRSCEDSGLAGADPAAASLAALDGTEPTALEALLDQQPTQQPTTTKRRKLGTQLQMVAGSSALEPLDQKQRALSDAVGSWSSSSSQLESSCASFDEGETGSDSSGLCALLLADGNELREAFFINLQSNMALAALVATEQIHGGRERNAQMDRPFTPDGRTNVQATLGAMYCLLGRARFGAAELTPELLVTALWLVQAWEDVKWQFASSCAVAYAKRDPAAKGEHAPLQAAMVKLQGEVLKRCGWSCRLAGYELHSAVLELSGSPEFDRTCIYVLSEACRAKTGFIQVGQLTYNNAAAAAAAMRRIAASAAIIGCAGSQCRSVPGHPSKFVTPPFRPKVADEEGSVTRAMSRARLSER